MHTGCLCVCACIMIVTRKWMGWWHGLYFSFLSFLPHFKIPISLLAYLNPKSHFMHRRFETTCSIFPLSRFKSHTRSVFLSVHLYESLSVKNATNSLSVESQSDRVNGICKHCENIVIAFSTLSHECKEFIRNRLHLQTHMTKWNLDKLYIEHRTTWM